MNEMNNEGNNNQNFEQQNMNQNNNEEPVQEQPIQPEQPVNEPPKKESKKSYCGLLIVFMIISLLLAGFIVYDKTSKKEEPVKPEEKHDLPKEEIVDKFYETYDENSIVLKGEENNGNIYAVESISGLKDKAIEKIINDKIKDYGKKTYDDPKLKGVKHIVNCHLTPYANFNNLLSLKATSNDSHCNSNLNLDLNTGDVLKIEDLFIPNADIEKIILNTGIRTVYMDDEALEPEIIVGVTDEKLIEEIKNKKYDFYFDNLAIYIVTESEEIRISIADNLDNFVYFDKYKGNDLFEDNSIGKKGLSINARNNYITKLSNNAYIDVYSWEIFTKTPERIRKVLIEYLENKAGNNSDGSMNIITGYVDTSYKFYENSKSTMQVLTSLPTLTICKASSDYIHSEEFKTKIIELRFSEKATDDGYLVLENLKCEKLSSLAIYYTDDNYKIYDNVKDIFVDGFDVDKYLKEEIYDKAFIIDYTQEEAKNDFGTDITYGLNYYFTTYGIQLKGYELAEDNKVRAYNGSWLFNSHSDVYDNLRIFDDLKFEK